MNWKNLIYSKCPYCNPRSQDRSQILRCNGELQALQENIRNKLRNQHSRGAWILRPYLLD